MAPMLAAAMVKPARANGTASWGTYGEWLTTPGQTIRDLDIADVDFGILVAANNITLVRPRVRRLTSSTGTAGAAIVAATGVQNLTIIDPDIDGTDAISDAGAITFYPGTFNCRVRGGVIRKHPHVAISMGSTSYAEWTDPLPASYHHAIAGVLIEQCGSARGGDAGSGITGIGQTHRVVIDTCTIRWCVGKGIAISGALQGTGAPGTPKLTESPTGWRLLRNRCDQNGEEGISAQGANYLTAYDNSASENGQRGGFGNYRFIGLGAGADLRGIRLRDNDSDGTAAGLDVI